MDIWYDQWLIMTRYPMRSRDPVLKNWAYTPLAYVWCLHGTPLPARPLVLWFTSHRKKLCLSKVIRFVQSGEIGKPRITSSTEMNVSRFPPLSLLLWNDDPFTRSMGGHQTKYIHKCMSSYTSARFLASVSILSDKLVNYCVEITRKDFNAGKRYKMLFHATHIVSQTPRYCIQHESTSASKRQNHPPRAIAPQSESYATIRKIVEAWLHHVVTKKILWLELPIAQY